ncbi:MAG: metallophosphoesterase [Chromatiales bacterium]|nr:MAG: metallophosphoesterase [Chromatiales bacterium]
MSSPLIAPLAAGPLDIVGDVHGEIDALDALLAELGYAGDGQHPDGRQLVFLGDLVDRGPDSPAVLERVSRLVAAGRAQCVLGNHELNLLRDVEKHGNGWWVAPDKPLEYPARPISPADKPRFTAFLQTLPLILERADLRVVHACWHPDAVARIRAADGDGSGALALFNHFQGQLREQWQASGLWAQFMDEWRQFGRLLKSRDWEPVRLDAMATVDSQNQMANPVAVLTSGAERPAPTPLWAGGRWRMVERETWWDEYEAATPVVIGHYWRRYSETGKTLMDQYGPDVFAGVEPHQWMGRRRNVYCVDFSVGGRYVERIAGGPEFQCRLAALRMPEWTVVHDDGIAWDIGPPG